MINDALIFGGAGCVIAGCFFITPALALVALGLLLLTTGATRMVTAHRQRDDQVESLSSAAYFDQVSANRLQGLLTGRRREDYE